MSSKAPPQAIQHNRPTSITAASQPSAYTAFNQVDELVAKPVVGSDGAAKWQNFRKDNPRATTALLATASAAPTAPLKATDRAAGFHSWKEEKAHADRIRHEDGSNNSASGVYTHFSKKPTTEGLSAKERKRIVSRLIGDDQDYFVSSSNQFIRWKFDYVFTTKPSHGTGYYFDGMDSLKKLRGEWPTSTDSSNHYATENSKTPTDDATTRIKKKRTKEKKRKASALPIIVNDPNHPLEQVAAALAKRQQATTMMPAGWEAAVSSSDGKEYYYNRSTGERTWTRPQEPTTKASDNNTNSTIVWKTAIDPSTLKTYYYNAETSETVWEKPSGVD